MARAEPVSGAVFEDTIDGYFPLSESLGQMLARQGFDEAWVEIAHAPMMHIPGLAADEPVPLRLAQGQAGMIRRLSVRVRQEAGRIKLSGSGVWRWLESGPEDLLPEDIRLAEPAFLRGIGMGGARGNATIAICPHDRIDAALRDPAWSGAHCLGPIDAAGGIRRSQRFEDGSTGRQGPGTSLIVLTRDAGARARLLAMAAGA